MYERFDDSARLIVTQAREESRARGHDHIGTEHLLLGLVYDEDTVACRVLEAMGASPREARERVEQQLGPQGGGSSDGNIPFTARAKKTLELSLREALQLGHNYIGTEHLLLGLIREGTGTAARVLAGLGVELPGARQQVTELAGVVASGVGGNIEARLDHIDDTLTDIGRRLAAIEERLAGGRGE